MSSMSMDRLHPAWGQAGMQRLDHPLSRSQEMNLSFSNFGAPAHVNQDGTMTMSQEFGWTDFFGPGVRTSDIPPYSQEKQTLPDAFKGDSIYMSKVMINLITADDAFYVREVLPWKLADDKMSIQWDEWRFDDHLLSHVPEESVVRLVSSQMSSESAHFRRYGLGMLLEHGFMNTPQGRLTYAMNLQQIKNAIVETNCLGVMMALLSSKPPADIYNHSPGDAPLSTRDFELKLRDEIDMWAIVQKQVNGFDMAYDRARRILTSRGVTNSDYTIIPEGVDKYQMQRPENTNFFLNGQQGTMPKNSVMASGRYGTIRESRPFRMSDGVPAWDPMFSQKVTGEYRILCDNYLGGVASEEYQSRMRAQLVYDQDLDNEVPVELLNSFRYCGLFLAGDAISGEFSDDTPDRRRPATAGKVRIDGEVVGETDDAEDIALTFRRVPLSDMGREYFNSHNYSDYLSVFETAGARVLDKFVEKVSSSTKLMRELAAILGLDEKSGGGSKEKKSDEDNENKRPVQAPTGPRGKTADLFGYLDSFTDKCAGGSGIWLETVLPALDAVKGVPKGFRRNAAWMVSRCVAALIDGKTIGEAQATDVATAALAFLGKTLHAQRSIDGPNIEAVYKNASLRSDKKGLATVQVCKEINDDKAATDFSATIENAAKGAGDLFVNTYSTIVGYDREDTDANKDLRELAGVYAYSTTDGATNGDIPSQSAIMQEASTRLQSWLDEHKRANGGGYALGPSMVDSLYVVLSVVDGGGSVSFDKPIARHMFNALHRVEEENAATSSHYRQPEPSHHSNSSSSSRSSRHQSRSSPSSGVAFRVDGTRSNAARAWIEAHSVVKKLPQTFVDEYLDVFIDLYVAYHKEKDFDAFFSAWVVVLRALCQLRSDLPSNVSESEVTTCIGNLVLISGAEVGAFQWPYTYCTSLFSGTFDKKELIRLLRSESNLKALLKAAKAVTSDGRQALQQSKKPTRASLSTAEAGTVEAGDAVKSALRSSTVTEGTLFYWTILKDLPHPIGYIEANPHIRHLMAPLIHCKAGEALGNTYIGHVSFEVGDDVVRKMHTGNLTAYMKPLVRDKRNIVIIPNIFCADYQGGGGTRYWDPNDQEHVEAYRQGDVTVADVFAIAVPLDWANSRRGIFLDIVGRYDPQYCADSHDSSPAHYPTHKMYCRKWGWKHATGSDVVSPNDTLAVQQPRFNTVCVQGFCRRFRYTGKGRGDFIGNELINQGHWGADVYPGCGKVRRGVEKHLKPASYSGTQQMYVGL